MAASPQERFDAAVKVIKTIPKDVSNIIRMVGTFMPSQDMMLKFYAYFKQATQGPISSSRPAFWDVIGKAKWDAWNKLGDMPKEEAMELYVAELKKIVEAMPHTEDVQGFVEKLGDFYETIDEVPPGVSEDVWNKRQAMLRASTPDQHTDSSPHRVNGHAVNGSSAHASNGSEQDLATETISICVKPVPLSSIPPADENHRPNGHISQSLPLTEHHRSCNDRVPSSEDVLICDEDPVSSVEAQQLRAQVLDAGMDAEDDVSSDGDEFCDTTDGPLIEAEILPLSASNNLNHQVSKEAYSSDYVDMDHSDSGISHQSETREAASSAIYAYHSGLNNNKSAAEFTIGPNQLFDHSWSNTRLSELSRLGNPCSEDVEPCDTVMARGGGENPGESSGGQMGHSSSSASMSGQRMAGLSASGGPNQRGPSYSSGGAGGGDQRGGAYPNNPRSEINEQIAVALLRLQQDMNNVLVRLHSLELKAASRAAQENPDRSQSSMSTRSNNNAPWWWPFTHMNKKTIFVLLVWPFIVQWMISFVSRRSKRSK